MYNRKILNYKAEFERIISDLKDLDKAHERAVLNELKTYINKKKRLVAHLESIHDILEDILSTNNNQGGQNDQNS